MQQSVSNGVRPSAFRYCLDPIFLSAAALYALNRLVLKPTYHIHFCVCYGNSLLTIAFCLPPTLFVYRLLGLREKRSYPTRFEILSHLVVWSLFFKWLAPVMIKGPFAWVVADPWDVFWYTVGAVIAGAMWGAWSFRFKGYKDKRSADLDITYPEGWRARDTEAL